MRTLSCEYACVLVKNEPRLRKKSFLDSLGCLLDDVRSRYIACINGVETLLLLCRITAVIVSRLPVDIGLGLTCKAAPAPEIETCKQTAFLC